MDILRDTNARQTNAKAVDLSVLDKMSIIWHLLSIKILSEDATHIMEQYMMNPAKMESSTPNMKLIHFLIDSHPDKWQDCRDTLIRKFLAIMPDADMSTRYAATTATSWWKQWCPRPQRK
jgi:prephenate dehydratase